MNKIKYMLFIELELVSNVFCLFFNNSELAFIVPELFINSIKDKSLVLAIKTLLLISL